MNTQTVRKGFTIIEFVLVLAVLAIGGFVGYRFFSAMTGKQAATTTSTSAPATGTNVATVKSAQDLDTVNKQLDSADVSGSFDQELNAAGSF